MWDYWYLAEGIVNMYYGRIRNGKNFNATMDLLNDLMSGQVVYANWIVKWEGYDERRKFLPRFWYFLKRRNFVWVIPKENFHFVDTRDPYNIKIDGKEWSQKMTFRNKEGNSYTQVVHDIWNWIGTITSATIYLDEAHKFFDSYAGTRLPMEQRLNVLSTGHFDRTINVISQRPTAIHVVFRGNVNVFYKCEKIFDYFGIRIFRKSEYQDMVDETVDEEQDAISTHYYLGTKKRYAMYDTKYMRGDMPESQENLIIPYKPKSFLGSKDKEVVSSVWGGLRRLPRGSIMKENQHEND